MGRAAQLWHLAAEVARAVDRVARHTVPVAQAILAVAFVIAAGYMLDRRAPFEVIAVEPASARAGDYVVIRAAVRRDASRACNASSARFLFDAGGYRYDLGQSIASAEMITDMERRAPGQMLIAVKLPEQIALGPAEIKTVLDYVCHKPHILWPIRVTTTLPFTVVQ